jgi:hypothetical protein
MNKTNNTMGTELCGGDFAELVASAIEDFLSQGFANDAPIALMELAAALMSTIAWMEKPNSDLDGLFQVCKEATLRNLKHRADLWRAKVAAVERQIEAA